MILKFCDFPPQVKAQPYGMLLQHFTHTFQARIVVLSPPVLPPSTTTLNTHTHTEQEEATTHRIRES